MKYKVTLGYDEGTESPSEFCDIEVFSFNPRHTNHKHPSEFGIGVDEFGDVYFSKKDEGGNPNAYRSLFKRGLLFVLSYYEHGNCTWSLKGEGMDCRWDTTRVAGILLLNEETFKGMRLKRKEEAARSFCENYTSWCNGTVYYYSIEDESGEPLDSCGGFYDAEELFEHISNCMDFGPEADFEFTGEAKWLADYHSIKPAKIKTKKRKVKSA